MIIITLGLILGVVGIAIGSMSSFASSFVLLIIAGVFSLATSLGIIIIEFPIGLIIGMVIKGTAK